MGTETAETLQEFGIELASLKDQELPEPNPELVRPIAEMMATPTKGTTSLDETLHWFKRIQKEIRCHHFYAILREVGGTRIHNYSNFVDLHESSEWEIVA